MIAIMKRLYEIRMLMEKLSEVCKKINKCKEDMKQELLSYLKQQEAQIVKLFIKNKLTKNNWNEWVINEVEHITKLY